MQVFTFLQLFLHTNPDRLLLPAAVVSVCVSVYVGCMFDKCTAGVVLFQGWKKKKALASSYQQQAVHSNKPGSKIGFKKAHGPTCATHLSSASAQEITNAAGLLSPRTAHHHKPKFSRDAGGLIRTTVWVCFLRFTHRSPSLSVKGTEPRLPTCCQIPSSSSAQTSF